MPFFSTLKTVTLGLVIAFHSVQCSVVIPYEFYGQGPYGVPDEFTRFGNLSSALESEPNSFTDYQSRYGVHLTIGTPPQDVWLLPHFYDSETYVNDLKICVPNPPRSSPEPVQYCEFSHGGLYSASESSSYQNTTRGPPFVADLVTPKETFPGDNNTWMQAIAVQTRSTKNYIGDTVGTLGLGSGSTFINTFFPGHEQIGIYFTGGNSSYGNPPPMFPLRPTIVYEMDVGGFNMTRSTGPKFTSKIGPPNPISNTTNPFVLTVTDVRIGKTSLLGSDEPYLATVDLSANTFDSFPDAVYNRFAEFTGGSDLAAKSFNGSGLAYTYSLLPKDPKDLWNVTLTFSNGYNITLPQWYLIKNFTSTSRSDYGFSPVMSTENRWYKAENPIQGPALSAGSLLLSSYIGIDYNAGEWWLSQAVNPLGAGGSVKTNTAAPGVGEGLKKTVLAAGSLAVAFVLFG